MWIVSRSVIYILENGGVYHSSCMGGRRPPLHSASKEVRPAGPFLFAIALYVLLFMHVFNARRANNYYDYDTGIYKIPVLSNQLSMKNNAETETIPIQHLVQNNVPNQRPCSENVRTQRQMPYNIVIQDPVSNNVPMQLVPNQFLMQHQGLFLPTMYPYPYPHFPRCHSN